MNGHSAPKASRPSLRALVLLQGSVRKSDLSQAVDRSLLDLPLDATHSVLSLWRDQAESLAVLLGIDRLPLRIVLSHSGREPTVPPDSGRITTTVERDAKDYRGTGGIIRDLASGYGPDDLMLIANGSQILFEPLPDLVVELLHAHASISFIGHRDGTPCGLFLVRCGAVANVRDIGFLDFKEQVLPKLGTAGQEVRAVLRDTTTAWPTRTLDGYISGIKAYTRERAGKPRITDPFSEDWQPTFSIKERDADVHPSATIHDSVVLRGGRVEENAVVVRSVVGPGAVVRAFGTVADRVIGTNVEARPTRMKK